MEIKIIKKPIYDSYYVFNPDTLFKLLCATDENIIQKIEEYIKIFNLKEEKRPKGYMLSPIVLNTSISHITIFGKAKLKYIDNIDLLINVLGRTVGNLYIPNREISFNEDSFRGIYIFPECEVI